MTDAIRPLVSRVPEGWSRAVAAPPPPEPAPGSFAEFASAVAFGELWNREELSVRERRIAVLAALATQGSWEGVATHLSSAVALGDLTRAEVEEIAVTLSVYAGVAVGVRLAALNQAGDDDA